MNGSPMQGIGQTWRHVVAMVLCAYVLAGCGVNRQLARQAEQVVERSQAQISSCTQSDHCAIDTPFRRLAAEAEAASTPEQPVHYVNVLDQGEDSLLLRIHLIRAARQSIDIQTFIWTHDDAGRLLLDELLTAARRGVRVRVLADQLFSLDDTVLLARLALIHRNFEVRIYNPTFDKAVTPPLEYAASILCCFTRFNQRMHNKLFLVDGEFGIAGGRNYENRYFDWDHEFDYVDRDVLVFGAQASREMRESFAKFWVYKRSSTLTRLNDVNQRLVAEANTQAPLPDAARSVDPMRVESLRARAGNVAEIERRFVAESRRVGKVDYFSDQPEKQDNDADINEQLGNRIAGMIASAHSRVILQTPYLVLSKSARRLFRELHDRDPRPVIIVSTNSLASTDAFYVYALSHKYKKRYLKLGFRVYEFKPFPADAEDLIANYAELSGNNDGDGYQRHGKAPLILPGVRLGMHSKSIVIDHSITLIGSHNFTPRSDNYNTESGFIIHDQGIADLVSAAILRTTEPGNSWTVAKRPRTNPFQRINNSIADFSTALPLFDFWPLRYATSYELDEGCQPLAQNDPDFYNCYSAVGDFPEVDLSLKMIYTRIITAFGAGAMGIL